MGEQWVLACRQMNRIKKTTDVVGMVTIRLRKIQLEMIRFQGKMNTGCRRLRR